MKKTLYVGLFIIFGFLLSLLLHVALEYPTLTIITGNMDRYGEGWLWQNWTMVHGSATIIMAIAGISAGLIAGRYFWSKLYDETGRVRKRDVFFRKD